MTLPTETRDLIQSYISRGETQNILTLVESLYDQRNRAEFQVSAYLHQIKVLSQSFQNITRALPKGETKAPQPSETPGKAPQPAKARTSRKTTPVIEVEIGDI